MILTEKMIDKYYNNTKSNIYFVPLLLLKLQCIAKNMIEIIIFCFSITMDRTWRY